VRSVARPPPPLGIWLVVPHPRHDKRSRNVGLPKGKAGTSCFTQRKRGRELLYKGRELQLWKRVATLEESYRELTRVALDRHEETWFTPPVHPTPYTIHPTPYTLHPTSHTLHPTPYNLHPTPHTVHYTPDTRHPTPTPYTIHPTP